MTGSGKTGLGIDLIEEAAIDGIPVIAIDPKGDLGNLLLTFPRLSAADFAPWVDADEARRAGQTTEAFAAAEAAKWSKGLAEWGQDGARIERLRAAADFALYTPGSSAGRPLSIVKSFAAPDPEIVNDADLLQDRVTHGRDQRADAGRRRCRADAQPRAHADRDALQRELARRPRSRSARRSSRRFRRRRSRRSASSISNRSSRRRIASRWRCSSISCSPRRASARGSKANRSTSIACSTARTAGRGSASFRSRTSTTRSACSSSRCCSTRSSAGCAASAAPRACARSSISTRSSASCRRSRTRPRRRRC